MQISRATFQAFADALWALRNPGPAAPAAVQSLFRHATITLVRTPSTRRETGGSDSQREFTLPLAASQNAVSVRFQRPASAHERFLLAQLRSGCGAPPARLAAAQDSAPSSTEVRHHLPRLTQRETEVLHWLAVGKRDADIATVIGVARRTVNKHVENILRKLKVETRGAAARLAAEHRGSAPAHPAEPWP